MAGSIRSHRRGGGGEDELDITPMIDMTFLLLIFFMVTSTMQDPEALSIPESKFGMGVDSQNAIILTVHVVDNQPAAFLGDKVTPNPVGLPEVTEYVRSLLSPTRNVIIIKSDRNVPTGFVQDVARAANEVEADFDKLFFTAVEHQEQ